MEKICHKTTALKTNIHPRNAACKKNMDDSLGSILEFEFIEMPQTSHSTRANKVLARSRNTVSMSALANEESKFHKELTEALGNDWQSNFDLTSTERFKGFVDTLCRTRSSPAICGRRKQDNQQENHEIGDLTQTTSNLTWNGLDDWTKIVLVVLIISLFMALMQSFDIL